MNDEWVCDKHPELSWPHDDCAGPGMPRDSQVSGLVYQRDRARKQIAELRTTAAVWVGMLVRFNRDCPGDAFVPDVLLVEMEAWLAALEAGGD